ncbi:MAG: peptidylprolyl isomerase, partial [Candidatus Nanohaloarchaea archaeon]
MLVDYIGKTDGEIFDLTLEDKAEEEGMKREDAEYQPIPVLVGEEYVIEGLDEALLDMDVGEEREVEIPSEKAYGKRDSDRVETYPEKEFEK